MNLISSEIPKSKKDLEDFIEKFDKVNICNGYPTFAYIEVGEFEKAYKDNCVMRHANCPFIIQGGEICIFCSTLERILVKNVDRKKEKKENRAAKVELNRKLRNTRRRLSQRNISLAKLKNDLKIIYEKCEKINERTLDDQLKELALPENQVCIGFIKKYYNYILFIIIIFFTKKLKIFILQKTIFPY